MKTATQIGRASQMGMESQTWMDTTTATVLDRYRESVRRYCRCCHRTLVHLTMPQQTIPSGGRRTCRPFCRRPCERASPAGTATRIDSPRSNKSQNEQSSTCGKTVTTVRTAQSVTQPRLEYERPSHSACVSW
eukprot:6046052-Prymnesium_polylepis.1